MILPDQNHSPDILIVDDIPDNLRLLSQILRNQGYRVRQMLQGDRALHAVEIAHPDLILLDIRMPGLDGYEVCRRLKASPTTQHIPIIFLSALNEVNDKVLAFEVGGIDYITKPFQELEVIARVRNHLQLQATQKELKQLNQTLEQKVQERTEALEKANEQQKILLEILEAKNQELQQTDKLKDEFLQTISHELRTPLNGIIGSLQLILSDFFEHLDDAKEFIQQAEESSYHLLSIINDILDVTKIKAGEMCIDFQPTDINQCIESAVKLNKVALQQKNIKFSSHLEEQGLLADADPLRLRQVLLNLIDNSIKFTEDGEINITSVQNIDWQTGQIVAQIIIQDTGIGIEPEQQKKLFRPFVMIDSSTTRKQGGTGLGLVISKNLIELMGGTIHLESTGLNQGTTVKVTLPLLDDIPSL